MFPKPKHKCKAPKLKRNKMPTINDLCEVCGKKGVNMKELPSKRIKDKRGMKFGRLAVTEYAGQNYHFESQWLCRCDCGNFATVLSGQLMSKSTVSCGCYARELISNINYKHGMTNTRLFHIWQGMRLRCSNQNNRDYKNYGSRGISVCKEWMDSFQSFHNWAVSNGYNRNLTIDRKNNDGNYEPLNCRWTTLKIQANNTRRNHIITINGISKTIAEWSDFSGIKWTTIKERVRRGDEGYDIIRPLWGREQNVS